MVGASQDGGITRRLPPWMHSGVTANAATSSNANSFRVKGRLVPEGCQRNAEKQMRRTIKRREKEIVGVGSGVGRNFAKKSRRRGKDLEETKQDAFGVRVGECVSRRRRKAKDDGEDVDMQSRVDQDEVDLTVDDLLNIAQEYVRAEEEDRKLKSVGSEAAERAGDTSAVRTTGGVGSRVLEKVECGDAREDMLNLLLGPLLNKPERLKTGR